MVNRVNANDKVDSLKREMQNHSLHLIASLAMTVNFPTGMGGYKLWGEKTLK
jgi:hypothetical protein